MTSIIAIPLARTSEVIVVQPYELTDDILNILRLESAPLEVWMECARGFLVQGRVDMYAKLLRATIDEAVARRSASPQAKFFHVQALCSLGDLNLQQAHLAEDQEQRRTLGAEANKLYFSAQKVNHLEMLPRLGLGEAALSNASLLRDHI